MLRRFETLLDPTAGTPRPPPNAGLVGFYWFYIRQVTGLTIALFVFGGLIAVLDTMIPAFIGRVVSMVSSHTPDTLFRDEGWVLFGMAFVLLVLRPLSFVAHNVLVNQIVNPGFSNMIRWQNHWCGKAGRSSRTISLAASPTGCCRPVRRCGKAW